MQLVYVFCNDVVHLTPEDFKYAFDKPTFINFCRSDISYCASLYPKYKMLADSNPDATIADVNCTEYINLCNNYNAINMPMLCLYNPNGTYFKYLGEQETADIKFWIQEIQRPTLQYNISNIKVQQYAEKIQSPTFFELYTNNPQQYEQIFNAWHGTIAIRCINSTKDKLEAIRNNVTSTLSDFKNTEKVHRFIRRHLIPAFTYFSPENFVRTVRLGQQIFVIYGQYVEIQDLIMGIEQRAPHSEVDLAFMSYDDGSKSFLQLFGLDCESNHLFVLTSGEPMRMFYYGVVHQDDDAASVMRDCIQKFQFNELQEIRQIGSQNQPQQQQPTQQQQNQQTGQNQQVSQESSSNTIIFITIILVLLAVIVIVLCFRGDTNDNVESIEKTDLNTEKRRKKEKQAKKEDQKPQSAERQQQSAKQGKGKKYGKK